MNRIVIETILKKAIRDIKDSPERSTRNLIDFALQFTKGEFQQHFLEQTQRILMDENSPYYRMVYDAVNNVDTDKLICLGTNICYNSCTLGAEKIRNIEEKEGFDIPWSLAFDMGDASSEQYETIIEQGNGLGIYTWFIRTENLENVAPLVKKHTDSAFILLCEPETVLNTMNQTILKAKNVMLCPAYDENDTTCTKACHYLRENRMLFSVHYIYGDQNAKFILNGDVMVSAQNLHPMFVLLVPDENCSAEVIKAVYDYALHVRENQEYLAVPWEYCTDNSYFDSIISENPCLAGFDAKGDLQTISSKKYGNDYNLFCNSLAEILKKVFPKKRALA